ncbi:PD-(D/E)XK nuclease family protein [Marinococcus halophilus]|uniref:PD-(D/E)XK nuclease family protein n=1 Tax=Marinococcus halophilus TaxID=1371 RepID=UPI001FD518C1|nr:PD-(D/E)XK nuclease family protein [Marinococcus halophilus]
MEEHRNNNAPELGKTIAKDFLELIFQKYDGNYSFSIKDLRLEKVQQQQSNIDVLLYLRNTLYKGPNVYIIIEDKTSSGESRKNQLEYYVNRLQKKNHDNVIIPVYFKTGYLSPIKKEELEHRELIVIDTYDIYSIMVKHSSNIQQDVILCSWWEHFYEKYYKNVLAIENLTITEHSTLKKFQAVELKGGLEPLFDEVSNILMKQFEDTWIMKKIKPQGKGQTSLQIMLTKDHWINVDKGVSASINFIMKRNFTFTLVLQIKTEPHYPQNNLTSYEIARLKNVQKMFKNYMNQAGLRN